MTRFRWSLVGIFALILLLQGFSVGWATAKGLEPRFIVRLSLLAYFIILGLAILWLVLSKDLDPFSAKLLAGMERMSGNSRWLTWSPFQSVLVRQICQHMTANERKDCVKQSALYGSHVAGPTAYFWTCALVAAWAFESPWGVLLGTLLSAFAGWFYASGSAAMRPTLAAFLCSTEWAKAEGVGQGQVYVLQMRQRLGIGLLVVGLLALVACLVELLDRLPLEGASWPGLALTWKGELLLRIHPWTLVVILATSSVLGRLVARYSTLFRFRRQALR